MYVQVDLRSPAASTALLEADDFRSLKVVVLNDDGDAGRLAQALAGVGTLDADGHACLLVEALRRLSGERAADPVWLAGFDAMIEYARARGWLAAGPSLRAHLESQQASPR
ncbi:hypothetical protein ABT009_25525 [Streptomyces sp. NPDC002896]|uniref:hypothetical protein n=1 Tax=Streptomyces sp. NPDC002896 TaxID=3154438 RepID=UPI00332B158C